MLMVTLYTLQSLAAILGRNYAYLRSVASKGGKVKGYALMRLDERTWFALAEADADKIEVFKPGNGV